MAARLNGSRITKARAHWSPLVAAGAVDCRRCHKPIAPADQWDLGHDHDLALGGNPAGRMTPEHQHCNRAAGAQLGNQLRHRPRRRLSEWLA
jgi:hypothetical protein